ncbi:hypothetical protein [Streptomyces sp. NPDC057496]|uniref:hypothetical protein n=1 Tax=Streptomyces sp. NPDC057496 TaxID=3346149 RepID=UPI00368E48F9
MSPSGGRTPADHQVRRLSVMLAVGAVLVSGCGVAADSMWLLGTGAWLLIAAILLDLVYRP